MRLRQRSEWNPSALARVASTSDNESVTIPTAANSVLSAVPDSDAESYEPETQSRAPNTLIANDFLSFSTGSEMDRVPQPENHNAGGDCKSVEKTDLNEGRPNQNLLVEELASGISINGTTTRILGRLSCFNYEGHDLYTPCPSELVPLHELPPLLATHYHASWLPEQRYTQVLIWCITSRIESLLEISAPTSQDLRILTVLRAFRQCLTVETVQISPLSLRFSLAISLRPQISRPSNVRNQAMLAEARTVRARFNASMRSAQLSLRQWERAQNTQGETGSKLNTSLAISDDLDTNRTHRENLGTLARLRLARILRCITQLDGLCTEVDWADLRRREFLVKKTAQPL